MHMTSGRSRCAGQGLSQSSTESWAGVQGTGGPAWGVPVRVPCTGNAIAAWGREAETDGHPGKVTKGLYSPLVLLTGLPHTVQRHTVASVSVCLWLLVSLAVRSSWQLVQGGAPTRPRPSASGSTTHGAKALASINLLIRSFSSDSLLLYPWIGSVVEKLIGK